MTTVRVAAQAQSSSIYFRITLLILASLLAAHCTWLLLAEFSRPQLDGMLDLALEGIARLIALQDEVLKG